MRLIRMNPRSRYRGLSCLHCHKRVSSGRVAFASTYYVLAGRPGWVTTFSRQRLTNGAQQNPDIDLEELEIRIVYHRACIEKILEHGAEDPEVMQSKYEAYRDVLLQTYDELP